MKITLLGLLGFVAIGALLIYVATEIHDDKEKGRLSRPS
jgi:hypothetical protein